MVGLSLPSRFSNSWTLRGPPEFVWLDYQRPPGFRMVELLEAPRFSYGWTLWVTRFSYGLTLKRPPVFVWLDSQRFAGILMVELLGAPRFSYGWTLGFLPVYV